MSCKQCARFRTTLAFDREYEISLERIKQPEAKKDVINYDFYHV